jgi:3-(3-hydroxy-phenyl)propionate hydroxylase
MDVRFVRGPDILVIGAGPVGLTAALAIRATGRDALVVEAAEPEGVRPGSRAIFLHSVTLRTLERIRPGLGWELARQGLSWSTKRTFYRGREVYQRSYPPPKPDTLPAATCLPQVVTERILLDACREAGVKFLWNAEVKTAVSHAGGIQFDLSEGRQLTARYAIAADGARSVVRESLGLHLAGRRTSNAYVIVDVAEDATNPLPFERVFHYEHPSVDHRNVLFVPFAGHWRVDLQCHPKDDPAAFTSKSGLQKWLVKVMPERYAQRITWVSTYIFRQAIATAFTDMHHRLLLAGEAGHVFAPFGARGLNSGIADAFVAAGAIDAALKAESPAAADAAIVEAADARLAAAARNCAASSSALRHLMAASVQERLTRWLGARLAPIVPSLGEWLDKAPFGPGLGQADRFGMFY